MTVFNILLVIYALGSMAKIKGINEKQNDILRFFVLFPMFALCAFRALSIGNDTQIYYYGYTRIGQYASLIAAIQGSRYEIGYTLLSYSMHKLGVSFLGMQIIISIIVYYSFYRFFVKYSNNFSFSCFVFLTLRYSMSTMNVVRMWLAIAILLYAIPFIQKRNLVPFLVLVAIASSFHSTALVFAILYPAAKVRINNRIVFSTFIVSWLLLLVGRPVFARVTSMIGRYSGYLSSNYFVFESNIAVYMTLAINLALFLLIYITFGKNGEKLYEPTTGNINSGLMIEQISLVCGLLVVAFSIVGLGNTIMDRISVYFGVMFTISIPSIYEHINLQHNKKLLYISMLLGLTAQYLVVMIMRPGWNGVTPYLFFWQQ